MFGLTWAMGAAGVFLIISPWVVTVGHSAAKGIIWNQVIVGGLTCLLAFATAGILLGRRRI
jgi:SPW repeat